MIEHSSLDSNLGIESHVMLTADANSGVTYDDMSTN